MIWHSTGLNDISKEFDTSLESGLTEAKAKEKLELYGPNYVGVIKPDSLIKDILAHLKRPVSVLLLVAAAISMLVNCVYSVASPLTEPLVIIALWLTLTVTSGIRDWVCTYNMSKLKLKVSPTARVIRGGKERIISASKLVPGDVILLKKGDLIPADARLIESDKLSCDESVLSGSSAPVAKDFGVCLSDIALVSERANMVYSGCVVRYGTAKAVVTETGESCEAGKINMEIEKREISVANKGLRKFSAAVNKLTPFVFIIFFLLDFLFIRFSAGGDEMRLLLIGARSYIYAAVLIATVAPQWVSSIATVILTVGTQRLVRKGAVVTDTAAVDTIGKVSVVCTDKAALTERRMKAIKVFNGREILPATGLSGQDCFDLVKLAAVCCDDTDTDPMEAALAELCLNTTGLSKAELENLYPRLAEIPFDSQTGMMATVNMIDGTSYAVVKGIPETIISLCGGDSDAYLKASDALGSEALHVIAVAVKPLYDVGLSANPTKEEIFGSLTFLGLIGMTDPIRSDAFERVKVCRATGSRVIMITGDSLATAMAIARQTGILSDEVQAITGDELDTMDDLELADKIGSYTVFARITPEDKVRIVTALQKSGESVLITGRTPSDCPALRVADVGCAMGMTGTDAARNAANVVLTDDNFSSIVSLINRGSTMYELIRKTLNFILSCSFGVVLASLVGFIIWHTPILTPIQLMTSALIFNLLPPFAFALEPTHRRKASAAKLHVDSFFEGGRRINVLWHGAFIAVAVAVAYAVGMRTSAAAAGATAWLVYIIGASAYSFSLRSRSHIFKLGIVNNPSMLIEIALCVLLSIALLGAGAIGFGANVTAYTVWIVLLSAVPLAAAEVGKIFKMK